MVNADPARTPTFAMFARPDYFLSTGPATCTGSCVTQNTGFAWDHGDYAAEINTNWLGVVGPGVAHLGLDGTAADAGPNSAGPDSGQITVPGSGTTGTWVDETDIRPTLLYLAGLKDDYEHDGRVISEIVTHPDAATVFHPRPDAMWSELGRRTAGLLLRGDWPVLSKRARKFQRSKPAYANPRLNETLRL